VGTRDGKYVCWLSDKKTIKTLDIILQKFWTTGDALELQAAKMDNLSIEALAGKKSYKVSGPSRLNIESDYVGGITVSALKKSWRNKIMNDPQKSVMANKI
jgi:hypothetical protein